jgi:ribosomal protein L44E
VTMKAIIIAYALTLLVSDSAAFIPAIKVGHLSRIILHNSNDAEPSERKISNASCNWRIFLRDQSSNVSDLSSEKPSFVGDKFELQYTCKVCETRNTNRVSRIGRFT